MIPLSCRSNLPGRYLQSSSSGWIIADVYYAGVGSDEESQLRELGRFLSGYGLNHAAPALLPRGLTNRSGYETCVADPDPYVFGPPGSGSVCQKQGFGSALI
jgi:hypothetical protein